MSELNIRVRRATPNLWASYSRTRYIWVWVQCKILFVNTLQIRFFKLWGKILKNLSGAAHDASHMTGTSVKCNKCDASKWKAKITIKIFGGLVPQMDKKSEGEKWDYTLQEHSSQQTSLFRLGTPNQSWVREQIYTSQSSLQTFKVSGVELNEICHKY